MAKADLGDTTHPEVKILNTATEIAFVTARGYVESTEEIEEVLGLLARLQRSARECEKIYLSLQAERAKDEKQEEADSIRYEAIWARRDKAAKTKPSKA